MVMLLKYEVLRRLKADDFGLLQEIESRLPVKGRRIGCLTIWTEEEVANAERDLEALGDVSFSGRQNWTCSDVHDMFPRRVGHKGESARGTKNENRD